MKIDKIGTYLIFFNHSLFKLFNIEEKGTAITPSRSESMNEWARSGSPASLPSDSYTSVWAPLAIRGVDSQGQFKGQLLHIAY